MLLAHLEALEDLEVGLVADERAGVLPLLVLSALLGLEPALLEVRLGELPFAEAPHLEELGEGVHGLRADAVHAGGELVVLVVVLSARVHLRDAVNHLAKRNAAPVVANGYFARVVVDVHVDALAETLSELVDRVVDHFLHQDVDAVVVHRARPGFADVHPGAHPYVRHRVQGLYA